MRVGVLALQGSIVEHENMLVELGVNFVSVRSKEDLESVSHLILPGGESTVLQLLMEQKGMWDILQLKIKNEKLKIFGTCAGAILCSLVGAKFGVERNGYGAQQSSFIDVLVSERFPDLGGVFIRAPRFKDIGEGVEVLATFDGEPVLLRDRNFLVASFHPELAGEKRLYEYFLSEV